MSATVGLLVGFMDLTSLLAFLFNSKERRCFKAGWWGRGGILAYKKLDLFCLSVF